MKLIILHLKLPLRWSPPSVGLIQTVMCLLMHPESPCAENGFSPPSNADISSCRQTQPNPANLALLSPAAVI